MRSSSSIIKLVLVGLIVIMTGLPGPAVAVRGADVLGVPVTSSGGLLLLIRPVLCMLLVASTNPLVCAVEGAHDSAMARIRAI